MRSARYFAADHGVKLPKRDAKEPSEPNESEGTEGEDTEGQSGSFREQRAKPDWFLHDDRDMDPGPARQGGDVQRKDQRGRFRQSSEWEETGEGTRSTSRQTHGTRGGRGGGRTAPTAPAVPGRTLPLLPQSTAWHYIDPEGKEQGPFDAKKLVNWVDLGYFGQADLQVRKTGKEVWVSLSSALPQIRKEAAGEFAVSYDRAKEPVRAAQVRNDDQPDRGRGSSSKAQRGGGRSGRARRPDSDDLLPVMPEGKRHPAEALLSPRDEEESGQRRYGRRGSEYVTPGPEAGSRGGRGRGRARGGRTARSDAPFPDFPVRGDQGLGAAQQLQPARGATQSGKGAEPVKAGKLAWKLFTADNKGAEEPTWRYIDPDGIVQGPFTAREMHTWLESNYLQMDLPICGMERKVSPPDLPPKEMYKTLGQLLQQIEQGHKFHPVTVKDVAASNNVFKKRTSNDGAESVEAKQDSEEARERGADTGSNQDAESVTARDYLSPDDSDLEEGEIAGRTAATDEDSDFEADNDSDDASVSSPHRPARPQAPAPQEQPASNTASPERPVSPQKAESHSALRQPASPEPMQEAASPLDVASPLQQGASVAAPASPEQPVSCQQPEVHAAQTQDAPVLKQSASKAASPKRSASPEKAGAHTAGPASQAGPASTAGPASPAGPASAHQQDNSRHAQPAQVDDAGVIVEEPEEEEQGVAEHDQAEQQERPHRQKGQASGLESIQIEEVSLQEAKQDSEAHSSPGKDEGTGMMQSVMGAAKSLFGGGKTDEQDEQLHGGGKAGHQSEQPSTSSVQAPEPTIYEPDTTESEATVDSNHAEYGTFEVHEESNGSNSGADDIGPDEDGGSIEQSVADAQAGMRDISISEH